MKKGLILIIALLVVAVVVAIVGFTQKGDVQKKLDEAVKLVDTTKTEAESALKAKADELTAAATAAKAEFEAKLAESETAKADLQNKVAELTTAAAAKSEFEAKLAQAEIDKTALQAKVDELTAIIEASKTESGVALQAKVDELTAAAVAAKAEVEAKLAEAETAKAALQANVDELTAAAGGKSETEAKLAQTEIDKAALQTKVDELTVAIEATQTEAGVALQAKVDELTAAADAAMLEAEAKLAETETAKTALQAKVDELTKAAEAAKAVPAPVVKGGQGMVTSIGSVADATVDKPGSAQVNTIVCSLLLDGQGKILKVTWDEQQTKIQFGMDGKPFELPAPEKLLTKLEKGDAYGMKKASAIGKEWYEQIAAFAEYCKGKTVDEVLAIKTVAVDASHPAVPNVEDLKTSVTVSVDDYLAALRKAADNAK